MALKGKKENLESKPGNNQKKRAGRKALREEEREMKGSSLILYQYFIKYII